MAKRPLDLRACPSSDASVHRDDRETLAVVAQQASAMVRRSARM
jgi:hypothetical protein